MKKQIVITGITNMSHDHICMSGYDASYHRYWRPILPGSQLSESFLNSFNAPIQLGSTIEMDFATIGENAKPPHIEDVPFDASSVRVVDSMTRIQFRDFVSSIADASVEAVFGYEIELYDGQPILPQGSGIRSLGAIIARKCSVYLDHLGKARCDFIDKTGCEYRHLPIVGRDAWIKIPGNYLDVPIRLSLSRLYQKDNDSEPVCWMQVSGVLA